MIIGIDINFANTEQRPGYECSTRRLMVSKFVKRHDLETDDILQSALPIATSDKVYFLFLCRLKLNSVILFIFHSFV